MNNIRKLTRKVLDKGNVEGLSHSYVSNIIEKCLVPQNGHISEYKKEFVFKMVIPSKLLKDYPESISHDIPIPISYKKRLYAIGIMLNDVLNFFDLALNEIFCRDVLFTEDFIEKEFKCLDKWISNLSFKTKIRRRVHTEEGILFEHDTVDFLEGAVGPVLLSLDPKKAHSMYPQFVVKKNIKIDIWFSILLDLIELLHTISIFTIQEKNAFFIQVITLDLSNNVLAVYVANKWHKFKSKRVAEIMNRLYKSKDFLIIATPGQVITTDKDINPEVRVLDEYLNNLHLVGVDSISFAPKNLIKHDPKKLLRRILAS